LVKVDHASQVPLLGSVAVIAADFFVTQILDGRAAY
jgi:hypothetical protein